MSLSTDERLFLDALDRHQPPALDYGALALRARGRGLRIRRRHQAVTGLAVATVGLGGVGAVSWLGNGHGPRSSEAQYADRTTPSAADPASTGAPSPSGGPTGGPTADQIRKGEHRAARAAGSARWYAVLDAPGWTAPPGQPVVEDQKAYYTSADGDASVSLNWRPAADWGPDWDEGGGYGPEAGRTTLDGDPATVYGENTSFEVIAAVREGRFLTLSVQGLTAEQVTELATHVHRQ